MAGARLKDFIFRGEALKLYRQFFRVSKQAPIGIQGELRAQIRQEFENNRNVSDTYQKKFLLSDGKNRLKQLGEMLGMSS